MLGTAAPQRNCGAGGLFRSICPLFSTDTFPLVLASAQQPHLSFRDAGIQTVLPNMILLPWSCPDSTSPSCRQCILLIFLLSAQGPAARASSPGIATVIPNSSTSTHRGSHLLMPGVVSSSPSYPIPSSERRILFCFRFPSVSPAAFPPPFSNPPASYLVQMFLNSRSLFFSFIQKTNS